MGFRRKHFLVGIPKITVGMEFFVAFRYPVPQLAATFFTPVTDVPGYHLSGATTQGDPNPPFFTFFEDK